MKLVNICNVDIPIVDEGNVGIAVSGGADSALLLYILMSNMNKDQKLNVYTVAREYTHYSSALTSSTVIDYCITATNFVNVEHNIRYIKEQTHDILYHPLLDDYNSGKILKFYSAVTANPDVDVANSFCGPDENSCQTDRDPLVYRDIFRGEHSITPFTNHNKKTICNMYKTLNIESLFNLTKSCESTDIEYKHNHCGKCWWCKEREWGFGKL